MFVKDEKVDYRLKIDPPVAERVDAIFRHRGISRTEAVSRIFAWFADLPPTIQQAALGQLPEDTGTDTLRLLLERLADGQHLPPATPVVEPRRAAQLRRKR